MTPTPYLEGARSAVEQAALKYAKFKLFGWLDEGQNPVRYRLDDDRYNDLLVIIRDDLLRKAEALLIEITEQPLPARKEL